MSKKEQIQSAEVVKTASGRQYHINLAPGEVAEYIILCGDPARADKVAEFFDSIELRRSNREYVTITGQYEGIRVSVMATGIGCGNTEIAVIELLQCVKNPVFIRVGSCGTLQDEPELGDLVISNGGVRLENVSTYFVPEGYPAIVHPDVQLALTKACSLHNFSFHTGLTATSPGFYGGQGRTVPGFKPRFPNLLDELAAVGVMNFEMESSALFSLATVGKARAGAVCAIYAQRKENSFISPETKDRAELNCIQAGLTAIRLIERLDKTRKEVKDDQWYPWPDSAEIEESVSKKKTSKAKKTSKSKKSSSTSTKKTSKAVKSKSKAKKK